MTRAAALVVLLSATAAAAEPIDLGPATLALDAAWTGPAAGPDPITSIARAAGTAHLVAIRYDIPNLEAWRDRTRPAHVDAIVAGFTAVPGTKLVGKPRVSRLGPGNVPTLDLTLRRNLPTDEVVAVRVLLFRTTTVAAIAASPADRAAVERAVAALTPE